MEEIDREKLKNLVLTTSKEEILNRLPLIKNDVFRYFPDASLEDELTILDAVIKDCDVPCIYVTSYDRSSGQWKQKTTPLFACESKEEAEQIVQEYNEAFLGKLYGRYSIFSVGNFVGKPDESNIKEELDNLLHSKNQDKFFDREREVVNFLKKTKTPWKEIGERSLDFLSFEYVRKKFNGEEFSKDVIQKDLYGAERFEKLFNEFENDVLKNEHKLDDALKALEDWRESSKLIVSQLNAEDLNNNLLHCVDESDRLIHFATLYSREIDTLLKQADLTKEERIRMEVIKESFDNSIPKIKKTLDKENKVINIKDSRLFDEGKILLRSDTHMMLANILFHSEISKDALKRLRTMQEDFENYRNGLVATEGSQSIIESRYKKMLELDKNEEYGKIFERMKSPEEMKWDYTSEFFDKKQEDFLNHFGIKNFEEFERYVRVREDYEKMTGVLKNEMHIFRPDLGCEYTIEKTAEGICITSKNAEAFVNDKKKKEKSYKKEKYHNIETKYWLNEKGNIIKIEETVEEAKDFDYKNNEKGKETTKKDVKRFSYTYDYRHPIKSFIAIEKSKFFRHWEKEEDGIKKEETLERGKWALKIKARLAKIKEIVEDICENRRIRPIRSDLKASFKVEERNYKETDSITGEEKINFTATVGEIDASKLLNTMAETLTDAVAKGDFTECIQTFTDFKDQLSNLSLPNKDSWQKDLANAIQGIVESGVKINAVKYNLKAFGKDISDIELGRTDEGWKFSIDSFLASLQNFVEENNNEEKKESFEEFLNSAKEIKDIFDKKEDLEEALDQTLKHKEIADEKLTNEEQRDIKVVSEMAGVMAEKLAGLKIEAEQTKEAIERAL